MRNAITACVLGLVLLAAASSSEQSPASASGEDKLPPPAAKLVFNERGEAAAPRGYRSWVHAYTAWEPITTSLLDEKTTRTPEFHNVYVEPNSYRTFMKTGRWPEGTLMVKEFAFTDIDPKNCDGPPAFLCNQWFGKAILEHGRIGIAVMLKDTKRYPAEAGGWAYFSYGHQPPPYQRVSAPHPRERCAQCHIDRAGADHDYVFSANQPGFSRAGDDAKHNLEAAFSD